MGIKAHSLRPVYLLSKTSYPGVIHIPVLTIRFLNPAIDLKRYKGIIFTSKQSVEAMKHYPLEWESVQFLCVSEATADHARRSGAHHVDVAQGYGESIPELLARADSSIRWLFPRPKQVASEWAETARRKGIEIDEAIVYETACNEEVSYGPIAADGVLIFTSPSSVRCFMQRESILPTHSIIVIGKTTQAALPMGVKSLVSDETSVASAVRLALEIAGKEKNSSPF